MRFKRMSEIFSRMVDHTLTNTNEISDFSVGSAIRAIYEAISIEIEQFYILTRENIKEAIEAGVYSSFGFKRREAQKAYNNVQIAFNNATQNTILLSRGTRFSSSLAEYPQVYETLEDYYIPAGTLLAEVEVHCIYPGEFGNVPAGVIDLIDTPITNVKWVNNPEAFQTGQDEEPIEELRARFRSFIKSLSRATVPSLEYGTREIEEVAGVHIVEEIGRSIIYAHDRNGNLPDSVKEAIERNIERYRPASIPVEVRPVERVLLDIDVIVTVTTRQAITERLKRDIKEGIERYLNNMGTSEPLILSNLVRTIMNIDNQFIYDVELVNLDKNVVIGGHQLIRAGEINVTLQ